VTRRGIRKRFALWRGQLGLAWWRLERRLADA